MLLIAWVFIVDGKPVFPRVGMKVTIVADNSKWMNKYPINIYGVKFELVHWYANTSKAWNAIIRCLIGKTGIWLYLFSHVKYLKFADLGNIKYGACIMKKLPLSPSQCCTLLSKEAQDGDNDMYSVEYLQKLQQEKGNVNSTNS